MIPTSTVAVPEVSPDDPRVVAALEAYLAAAEVGNAPDRAAFLSEHADIAGPLADCLDGLDFLRAAAPANVTAVPPADAPDRLGDFRLVREIGRGGMGVVYEAEQISLGRRVAVKVLAVGPGVGPAALRRFKHEARAAGLLAHPNVVPVYSVGCDRGVHFYAMRLVDGPSLADMIARPVPGARSTRPHARPGDPTPGTVTGPAPAPPSGSPSLLPDAPRFAAELALQAAEALAHAHAAGVVHRDIKPGNLLLDGDGRLWVTDFGLAYLPDASRLTRTGSLVGTLRYMSPEQVDPTRGGVDHRADLYGLGATLYELLTRRPPVDGDDQWTVVARILNRDPVPPRRLNPAVPADLETVVLTLLAKDPADRYRSAAALAADLRRFLAGEPVHARRPSLTERATRWAARHRRLVAAAAAVGLAVVTLQGVHQIRLAYERDETRAERQQARAAVDDFYTHVAERWLAHEPGMEPQQREFLAKARDHYERLASSAAGTREDRLSAAVALRRVADIDTRLGRPDPAADAYAEALARLRPLVAEHPGWADPAREAAIAATDYGTLLRTRGRLDDAGREYRAAADEFRALVGAGSADPFDRAGLAGVENNQGLLWQQLGKPAEAERCFRAARAGFAKLAAEFPDSVAFTSEAAGCCHNLAELFAEAGRDADAERAYRDALTLRRTPAEQAPAVPAYRRELARTQAALAGLLLRTGHVAEAGRLAAEAAAGRKRLAADFPATPAYRFDLACSLRTAAECAAAAGRPAEALADCDRAADLLRPLAASHPLPTAVGELARTRRTAGLILAAKADGVAEAALREAVELADQAGNATPIDRQTRTASRLDLARWYVAHGSPGTAARLLRPVAAEAPPDGSRDRALWAQARDELARLSAAQGGD